MNTQNSSVDLTQPGELNAIPWRDLNEKREFSEYLELALSGAADTRADEDMTIAMGDRPIP